MKPLRRPTCLGEGDELDVRQEKSKLPPLRPSNRSLTHVKAL